jgi:aspartate 1-decarboxylase
LRVAVAATLVSRKRFETYVIAPKTSSERIVSSGGIEN